MKRLPYPFPGMNPYLEHPILWEPTHTRLVVEIADQLQPQLDPRYIASVEERVWVEGPRERKPDVWIEEIDDAVRATRSAAVVLDEAPVIVEIANLEVRERRVEILDTADNMRLVTAIEIVSPSNKTQGEGRKSYLQKQSEFLDRNCHFVEIDLILRGKHVMSLPTWRADELPPYDYLTCVSRWPNRSRFELYPRGLRDRLPVVGVPLVAPDPDVKLDLQVAIEEVYHKARFGLRLRYDAPCVPALPSADQQWANTMLEQAGIREKAKKPRSANGRRKKT